MNPRAPDFIYLASQSPRRLQLLQQLGLTPVVFAPDDSQAAEALEDVRHREAPLAYVRRVTGLKLDDALRRLAASGRAPAPVLCADTTVAAGRVILGKPADAQDAARMLRMLSGQTHRVLTAVAVAGANAGAGGRTVARQLVVSESRVRFAVLTRAQVSTYVDGGEWQGKAGGYGIQGRAAAFVEHISGSYTGIMGLPLYETAALLRQVGVRC